MAVGSHELCFCFEWHLVGFDLHQPVFVWHLVVVECMFDQPTACLTVLSIVSTVKYGLRVDDG